MSKASHKLYGELAQWWPLMSPPSEYENEAQLYRNALEQARSGPLNTLLELGSGGGHNASHMKAHYQMTLVDLSDDMLAVSRALNPDCAHAQGDMRSVRLGRTFDGVFIHDAICYMLTEDDLRATLTTAWEHCRPGGVALFAPDYIRETYRSDSDEGGANDGIKGFRYLEWHFDPDPSDTRYTVDYAYMMREHDGTTRVVQERHIEGLFARADWLRLLSEVGFEPRALPLDHPDIDDGAYEIFVANKPE